MRIRINKILDKSNYIAPIIAAVIIMAGLVLTSYLVVRYKKYDDLKLKDNEETKEPHDVELLETRVETPPHEPVPDVVDGHLSDTQAAHELCKTCTEKIDTAEPERGECFF